MELTIGAKVGEGGFSDIYEATDAIGRKVAIKILRASAAAVSSALEHAQALARAQHPNVVSIIALETLPHPESGKPVDAIVMEHLAGDSLADTLRANRFKAAEAAGVVRGLVEGLRHIHAQGLANGDLHAENVMIVNGTAKIIDILYRDSLALLSTASKETLLRRDLLNLRLLVYDILLTSELDPTDAGDFNEMLGQTYSMDDIRRALDVVLDPSRRQAQEDPERLIQRALDRIRDESYVEGFQYARALVAETPNEILKPLLIRLLEEYSLTQKHRPYIRLLWNRLPEAAKNEIAVELANVLDQHVPRGSWGAPINVLAALDAEGWKRLPLRTQLRLESAIVNDVLAGHYDFYGKNIPMPGSLGTFTNAFWEYFQDKGRLLDNLIAKLKTNWHGQNYVGQYLLYTLTRVADTPEQKARAIDALQYAIRNDAKLIVQNLENLPSDWQAELEPKSPF